MPISGNVPAHVAIIMDGNGRWAKKKNLPVVFGHTEGVKRVDEILKAAPDMGIKILTLYTFSTENWSRPKPEVEALMNLLESHLEKQTGRMKANGVKLSVVGDIKGLPASVQDKISRSIELTKDNSRIVLNLALNYGSRPEIIQAVKAIASDVHDNKLTIDGINEKLFASHLYTKDLPDPDLLIRTSGEMRLSNFLLWQLSYSEIYVTDTLWPDFHKDDLVKALEAYQKRERRFGGR